MSTGQTGQTNVLVKLCEMVKKRKMVKLGALVKQNIALVKLVKLMYWSNYVQWSKKK